MRSNELGFDVPPPEMQFTADPVPAPEGRVILVLLHGGPESATYIVHACADGLVTFEGLRNTFVLGTRWRRAPPGEVMALEARLCRSGLDSVSLVTDRGHPHAALTVERCTQPIRIDFDTFASDAASTRAQRALDGVLDSLRVRPFAGLALRSRGR